MKDRRLQFTKFITRIAVWGSHLLGYKGSSLPGRLTYVLYPGILRQLSQEITTVFITGTNGKSTTTAFVRGLLPAGDIFSNNYGSNMETGIITAFLENTDRLGNPVSHIAVIECDECSLAPIARDVKRPIVVVLNLFEEQEERTGKLSDVLNDIVAGIRESEAVAVCINNDQPELCAELRKQLPGMRFLTFSSEGKPSDVNVAKKGDEVTVTAGGERYVSPFHIAGDFNVSNLAGAVATLQVLEKCNAAAMDRIEDLQPVPWHFQTLRVNGHKVNIYLTKNTECIHQVLDLVIGDGSRCCFFFEKSIVDGKSSRWIRKADLRSGRNALEHAVCAGGFARSVKKALDAANVKDTKILTDAELFRRIETTEEDLTILSNVYAMKKLRKHFS